MPRRGEVLVAIMNNRLDFDIAMRQRWYRVPASSQVIWLEDRWPPRWVAFYQTKEFGEEAHAVNYYARVLDIQPKYRWELFPNEPRDEKSERRYHQLMLEPLQRLPQPIFSRRRRRIVFIPTTWRKFESAAEINDLYAESSLEDRLWAELKQRNIPAERQELVTIQDRNYFLDFAIYCASGVIDVETDGDEWHANPGRAASDNLRDNDLEAAGWRQLRFTEVQIKEQMSEYCIPNITRAIKRLGGVEEPGRYAPRNIDSDAPPGSYQLGLFDEL